MKNNGEIIIIEDDRDDREFLQEVLESLGVSNKIVFFEDPTEVISYIAQESVVPFMVFSDINLPKLNGFELRSLIMERKELYDKCVPYIFLSTSDNPENIRRAYRTSAHGYFKKESNFKSYQSVIRNIIEYWKSSSIPSVR